MNLDVYFIKRISSELERFREISDKVYNFRCPFCGDSKINKYKSRGYLYVKDRKFLFHCHNCGISISLPKFIKSINQNLYSEYLFKKFNKENIEEDVLEKVENKSIETDSLFYNLKSAWDVSWSSEYLSKRSFRKDKRVFECNNVCEFVSKFKEKELNEKYTQKGIIFPLTPEYDNVDFGFQIRLFNPIKNNRYITHIHNKQFLKCWGNDHLNRNDIVYVTEGIFDACLFNNGIAALDANLHGFANQNKLNKNTTVLIFDNEPRNQDIIRHKEKAINDGWKVIFYNNSFKYKDLSEAKENNFDYMSNTTVLNGLLANLRHRNDIKRFI